MQPVGAIHPDTRTPLFFACAKEKGGKERRFNAGLDLGSPAEAEAADMATTARPLPTPTQELRQLEYRLHSPPLTITVALRDEDATADFRGLLSLPCEAVPA